ncbi:MAG: glycosyltransferase [Anaerolineae bacterium]|nr:glycosyltransferase [Gloeobacterales cyanobacterium ES-bin-313]
MPKCRVYLCTYRRNHLLPRALNSLINQSFQDWICELHNDDPADPFPGNLVLEKADPRIILVNHEVNLGPTKTFNLFFKSIPEPYFSILEDDNWWETKFLETMIETLDAHSQVSVAWANMRLWQECEDGNWLDTGKTTWQRSTNAEPELFEWPQLPQIFGALHSNGAMLARSHYAERYLIPEITPFVSIEPFRERCFLFPILLLPTILANFAITLQTSRTKDLMPFVDAQILLVSSFIKNVPMKQETITAMWQQARSGRVKRTNILLFAALLRKECLFLLQFATPGDWLFFFASLVRRPILSWHEFRLMSRKNDLWEFLDTEVQNRMEEARTKGFIEL